MTPTLHWQTQRQKKICENGGFYEIPDSVVFLCSHPVFQVVIVLLYTHAHAYAHTLHGIMHNVIVVCFSPDTSQATATVQVTVGDINDNSPSFVQTFYTAEVEENSRGGVFVVSYMQQLII